MFCAHGAGFVVPWEQVRSHMHVDSGWGKTAKTEETVQARPRRMAAYRATLEEDAELLKIFEQTYGPIKRDPLAAFRPGQKKERPAPPRSGNAPISTPSSGRSSPNTCWWTATTSSLHGTS